MFTEITYRNNQEPIRPDRFSTPQKLVPRLTPGMRSQLRHVSVEARYPLEEHELETPIKYRIFAKNVSPAEHTITLKDKLIVPKSQVGV